MNVGDIVSVGVPVRILAVGEEEGKPVYSGAPLSTPSQITFTEKDVVKSEVEVVEAPETPKTPETPS